MKKMKLFKLHTLAFFMIFFTVNAQTGKVIKIKDGDTFVILDSKLEQHTIRVADIDCPEKGQPFGKKAKWFTSNEIYGKVVTINPKDKNEPKDRWDRIIGYVIYGNNQNLSLELLKNGFAWHYKYYSDDEKMAKLEIKARNEKVGLWQMPNPINPYSWRKGERPVNYKK